MTIHSKVTVRILASDVIAVAKRGGNRDWAAYIGGVAGQNMDTEWPDVAEQGTKLPESIARAIFHGEPWKGLQYRT